MKTIRLDLPEPPSSNRYWRHARGRTYLSADAKAYRLTVKAAYLKQFGAKIAFPRGPITLCVQWFRARKSGDLSNRIKQLEDALRGLAYTDDNQTTELHMYRHDDALTKGRVLVEVLGGRA